MNYENQDNIIWTPTIPMIICVMRTKDGIFEGVCDGVSLKDDIKNMNQYAYRLSEYEIKQRIKFYSRGL